MDANHRGESCLEIHICIQMIINAIGLAVLTLGEILDKGGQGKQSLLQSSGQCDMKREETKWRLI